MKQILIVESSPRGTESASRKLTDKLRERLETRYPEATIIERDLVKDKLPHLDQPTLKQFLRKTRWRQNRLSKPHTCPTSSLTSR
jgi:FMN-dependent NADH-azoreductase